MNKNDLKQHTITEIMNFYKASEILINYYGNMAEANYDNKTIYTDAMRKVSKYNLCNQKLLEELERRMEIIEGV